MDDKKQPIIIKRIKKGGHGHHGGAWKVAFADFVTAMMAFFLLMWLLGTSTEAQLSGITNYFENVSFTEGMSAVAPAGSQGPGGASTSVIDLGGGLNAIKKGDGEEIDKDNAANKQDKKIEEQLKEQTEQEKDKKRLDSLMEELQKALAQSQALAPYKDQLLLDITPEGLRIQIIDKENRPMFESGSARLKHYTEEILLELAHFINAVPNRISISGHTDAVQFEGKNGYSNWELSADRANAARRTLVEGGLDNDKLARVVGLASSVPFDRNAPESATNRRISIIVMNRKTEQALSENNTGNTLNALPVSAIDSATDTSDGVEQQINAPGLDEQPALPAEPGSQKSGEPAADDLNALLRELQTLNPQGGETGKPASPANNQEASATPTTEPPPGNPPIQAIDPALLPRGKVQTPPR